VHNITFKLNFAVTGNEMRSRAFVMP
jgi:hypothetical protein